MLIVAISLTGWVQYARTVRGSTLVERNREYVQAARVIGVKPSRIMFRHVLPNVMGPVLVLATIHVAAAILTEATLSFLGVGVPPTSPSLGTLIRIGNDFLFSGEWWITIFPGRDADPDRADREPARRLAARRAESAAALNHGRHRCSKSATCASSSRPAAARCSRWTTSPSTSRRARSSAWSASPAPASRSPARPSSACSSRRAASPAARSGSAGQRIDNLPYEQMRAIRGRRIGAIFQDPLTSLNPLYTIGRQLTETILTHLPVSAEEARQRAIRLLQETGIPAAEERLDQYPHQFSGGMRQRVVIALALAAEPELIVADEPTTALDVSIQAQIISLLKRLCKEHGAAVMLVTHDMGVIAETCDRVAVMYAGRIGEIGPVHEVIHHPAHPYTAGLMGSIPAMDDTRERLLQIDGAMPRLNAIPARLRLQPALPAGDGPLPPRAAGPERCRRARAPPAGCMRRSRRDDGAGRGRRPGEDLRRLGALAEPRHRAQAAAVRACGRWRQLRHRQGQDAGAGGRIRLRQEHGGAAAGRPVRTDARHGASSTARTRACSSPRRPTCAACAGACR